MINVLKNIIRCLLSIAVLLFISRPALQGAEYDKKDVVSFEIVNGLILLPLSVDGQTGNYILDSGVSSLILNQPDVRSSVLFSAIGHDIPALPTEVNHLMIGSVEDRNVHAWQMDLAFVERLINRKIDGLIGIDFLLNHDVFIDYGTQELTFISDVSELKVFDPLSYQTVGLPIEIHNQTIPVVSAQVDGKNYRMIFDTGAALNVLYNKRPDDKVTRLTIEMNGLVVDNAQFITDDFANFDPSFAKAIDGIMSATSLNADSMIISLRSRKILLFYKQQEDSVAALH